MLDFFLHLDQHLLSLVADHGVWVYALVFAVIFCETGLIIMPFLPGDSLLFITGAIAGSGHLNPWAAGAGIATAALLGDNLNYWIGRRYGTRLFNERSRWLRREHLARTEAFYAHHGGKMVMLARFVPLVRTFAPFVAGISHMPWIVFTGFSLMGALLWTGGLVSLGYFLGNVPFLRDHLEIIILGVAAVMLLPVLWRLVRRRTRDAL
ncbi:membrane-associated protein [Kushneria avicenniae]|uniref:Membrane-associated protein n=1 Tax=Kushneria avicenniae TaxID=402385 RepID=A0A1I1LMR3_9GAMM|nr:VTT domain-containing protein [Kushneria avicenniae]SFC74236.1 membrane-associated protein [Kushneria avicenniae]